jgi:hypothetical protein
MYFFSGKYSVDTNDFLSFIFLNSAACVFIFMMVEIFKGIIHTGYPYLNIDMKLKARYKKNVLLFWVFGKVFNMLLCSFMIISSSMTGHSYYSIEQFLSDNYININIFFIAILLDLFFSETANIYFTLNNTFIEAFEPEEIARESSLLINSFIEEEPDPKQEQRNSLDQRDLFAEKNFVTRTIKSMQTTFNGTFNQTNDATLISDNSSFSNKVDRRDEKSKKLNFA